jgi:predicted phosphodiesterase
VSSSTDDVRFELRNPLAVPTLLRDLLKAITTNYQLSLIRHLATVSPSGDAPLESYIAWQNEHFLDVYPIALAWEEHARALQQNRGRLTGAAGALAVGHARYAELMTGVPLNGPIWTLLFAERDPSVDAELTKIERPAPAGPPREEPAHFTAQARAPRPEPPVPLFTWLHLSDIHFGHPSAGHRSDQKLVLDALREDIAAYRERGVPNPDVVVVTGDIAFSGIAPQYADAEAWLRQTTALVGLDLSNVYAVAGNHDVERAVDNADRNIKRLVHSLREGHEDLDEILNAPSDLALLRRRQQSYLDFVSKLAPSLDVMMVTPPDGQGLLFWAHRHEPSGRRRQHRSDCRGRDARRQAASGRTGVARL